MKVEMIHKVCGEVAFYYDHVPKPSDAPDCRAMINLDGSKPEPTDAPICGTCGEYAPMRYDSTEGVEVGHVTLEDG